MLFRFSAAMLAVTLAASFALSGAGPGEFDALARIKGPEALEVIESPTLYRVAQMKGLPCSMEAFGFLVDRPRTSMVLARAIDPTLDEYEIQERPGGGWHVDDRGRLAGDMELIESGPGRRVYYISGHWRFVFGVTFKGRMVLVPEFGQAGAGDARAVDARARGYMKIDNALIGFMAKVVTLIFPGKVDARIERFAGAVRKVAEAVQKDPAGMYGKLIGSGKVPPREAGEFRAMFMGSRGGGG